MDYDFLITTSWSRVDVEKTQLWANELGKRGYSVAYLSLANHELGIIDDGIDSFSLPSLVQSNSSVMEPEEVERHFDVPSLPLICHAEREIFGLSYRQALKRACAQSVGLRSFFAEHSVSFGLQNRGPEIHRILTHYALCANGGEGVWIEQSPFEGMLAFSTSAGGEWDAYRKITYDEMSKTDRRETQSHITSFRDEQRFLADPKSSGGIQISSLIAAVRAYFSPRDRPGSKRTQVERRVKRLVGRYVNAAFLPSIERSRELCQNTDYVFFPLQYPFESRLTVLSPQFFRQEYVIEYLSRALPSSVALFVKPHPNHPHRPSPRILYSMRNSDRVEFLNPALNAHEVIDEAEAVVVTNNTVGFETLYYGKPLFTLGEAPYGETPAAIDVTDLGDLPELFQEHLSTTIPEETTIESIHSLRAASRPGDRAGLDDEEIQTLINSVERFVFDAE